MESTKTMGVGPRAAHPRRDALERRFEDLFDADPRQMAADEEGAR